MNILNSIKESNGYIDDDRMIVKPYRSNELVDVYRGPNIRPMPLNEELDKDWEAKVILKVEDNITTDDIMPAGAKILPLRSNVPEIAKFVYSGTDPTFYNRAKELGKSIIVAGRTKGKVPAVSMRP